MKLSVASVWKKYGDRTVIQDCSVTFNGAGIYVLMGQNGSGKSTFLRICALLELPDSGHIAFSLDETPLAIDLALKRRLTLVLPGTGVFNSTVFNNVAYGLRIRGTSRSEIEKKVKRVLSFVGLDKRISQRALTLSSGETRRLGIARALVIEPDILFLDEPTASVDQENTEIIEAIVTEMNQVSRSTIIMTTHDREQAERLADVMLIMKNGAISQQSP